MSRRACRPHRVGVSPELAGRRWYVEGCAICEAKLARGLVSSDDGPPPSLYLEHRPSVRKRNKVLAPWG